ncbi:FAD-dependent oxidoreductase [Brevundimonas sp. Leaf363]|uniref:FAD/NAD(P)-binding protein n=1 Tax=Brevundimonas sp. Leaf363 TaxID=1736353 RepID=UPI0007015F03|nr:FAD/NAD(P)-binding protein [Brevundimonas sp. Leaf363]KQS52889.1 FAD-dependent oxidoreductase [Brevundimonas sp. Leaf363]
MTSSIAFVGAGPTTLYTLNALLAQGVSGARITVFEAQPTAGLGSPYRPGWNDPAMLSNIASVEIPPLGETLLAWLHNQTASDLHDMGVQTADISDRAFVPRVALGRYFQDQFDALMRRAREAGNTVDIRTRCRVVDAANTADGMRLTLSPQGGGGVSHALFDHVVLATGHQWPSQQEVRPGYFLSPWPATTLASLPATDIGIRGSSLTAIDAAVAIAGAHGAFVRQDDALIYQASPGTERLRLTMMSRKGLLPEADYYFPLPHAPLDICTPEAIGRLTSAADAALLDDVFDLFRRELMAVDPAYAAATGLEHATLETFSEAYFAERAAVDPFEWAAANLEEARANHAAQVTVPWRDAILRMHEVVAAVVPHLDGPQFQRFNRDLKPIFVDAYGAVPHESVERMLALRRAGVLQILALGDDYRIDTHRPEGGVLLIHGDRPRHFPVFIEATGQRPLGAIQFPFLSLLEQGIVRDESSSDAPDAARGIVIDDVFHPIADGVPEDRLFCLSLPFIMGRHPFVQGITSSHEMGEIVGRRLALALGAMKPVSDALQTAA